MSKRICRDPEDDKIKAGIEEEIEAFRGNQTFEPRQVAMCWVGVTFLNPGLIPAAILLLSWCSLSFALGLLCALVKTQQSSEKVFFLLCFLF